LVADDEELVRATARGVLEWLGFEVWEARDGEEAVQIYQRTGGGFACVLLDFSMPRMGGPAAAAALRGLDPGVRVVLASGYDTERVARGCVEDGVAGFLQKPFTIEEMARVMRRVCGG
jgi:CheY-like chemotaxis protein